MDALTRARTSRLLKPSEEEDMLRQSVSAIAARYGPDYFQRVTDEGKRPTELWRELTRGGFLSVHLPEAYGGGGGGLYELSAVIEEASAAGVPPLSAVFSAAARPLPSATGDRTSARCWYSTPITWMRCRRRSESTGTRWRSRSPSRSCWNVSGLPSHVPMSASLE